jgi:NitT/TauT family transport system permease protein
LPFRIVVGVLLGFLIGSSRMAYTAIYPLMVAFNAVPKAAVVPILVVWFGIGLGPGILTAFLISFFPITVNIATGLATLEPELEDVLRVLGASAGTCWSRSACRARCRTSTAR